MYVINIYNICNHSEYGLNGKNNIYYRNGNFLPDYHRKVDQTGARHFGDTSVVILEKPISC